jgi:hypothetical protein
MRWFGPSAEPPFRADYIERAPIPTGERCARCEEPIAGTEFGFFIPGISQSINGGYSHCDLVFHEECHLRGIFGSVEHQMKPTCDRTCKDDPSLTRREAAKAAVEFHRSRRPFR